jgi:hypothetical protein
VASYADKINEFNRRIADIASKLASLGDKRKSYSLAAASGDARALKQVGEVDWELDALRKEQQTLNSAVETAEALERQSELEVKAEEDRARQQDAYRAARGVVSLNEEIDLALKTMREMFERRAVILKSLANTGVCDPNLVMKLASRSGPTSAAHAAGLGKFVNLEMTPVVAQRPLADSNSLLLGIGTPPSGNGSNGKPLLRPVTKSRGAP